MPSAKSISARARQARLFEAGLCTSCGKVPRDSGDGATLRYCPNCAEKIRTFSRTAYRKRRGIDPDAPLDPRGRPLRSVIPEP
jgi:predicted RNA-binding Zn-ribbon protein involved in translation (DUF1610 family)